MWRRRRTVCSVPHHIDVEDTPRYGLCSCQHSCSVPSGSQITKSTKSCWSAKPRAMLAWPGSGLGLRPMCLRPAGLGARKAGRCPRPPRRCGRTCPAAMTTWRACSGHEKGFYTSRPRAHQSVGCHLSRLLLLLLQPILSRQAFRSIQGCTIPRHVSSIWDNTHLYFVTQLTPLAAVT